MSVSKSSVLYIMNLAKTINSTLARRLARQRSQNKCIEMYNTYPYRLLLSLLGFFVVVVVVVLM